LPAGHIRRYHGRNQGQEMKRRDPAKLLAQADDVIE